MTTPQRSYRYYDFVMAAFVCVLLCANLIGAAKAAQITLPIIGAVSFSGGVLFFPISYIFGDILTEVYGYGRDRRVVWAGFAALVFASLMAAVVLALPPVPDAFNQSYQGHLEAVFGNTWRIVAGSMIAFWCGSFANRLCDGENENLELGPLVVDTHYRLNTRWRGSRFEPVLCHRFLRHLA